MYKSATEAFQLVGGSVVMLYVRASCRLLIFFHHFFYLLEVTSQGISTTIVFVRVRVEMGITDNHKTSRTRYSTNSRQGPILLAPIASNLNHTTTIEGFEVSDVPIKRVQ